MGLESRRVSRGQRRAAWPRGGLRLWVAGPVRSGEARRLVDILFIRRSSDADGDGGLGLGKKISVGNAFYFVVVDRLRSSGRSGIGKRTAPEPVSWVESRLSLPGIPFKI